MIIKILVFCTLVVLGLVDASRVSGRSWAYAPGSFIGLENGFNMSAKYPTYHGYLSLYDASNGDNYTVHIGINRTLWAPNLVPHERLYVFAASLPNKPKNWTLEFWNYAPKSAPVRAKDYNWCVTPALPGYDNCWYHPIVLNSNVFAFCGTNIYKVKLPKQPGGECTLTPILKPSLPISFSTSQGAVSVASPTSITFITNSGVATVTASKDGDLALTLDAPLAPEIPDSTFSWMQQDPLTSKIYYSAETRSFNSTLWVGNPVSGSEVEWTNLPVWTSPHAPGDFFIDSRYVGHFGGPLLCSLSGMPMCVTTTSTTLQWMGHSLNDPSATGGVGPAGGTMYDPNCN